MPPAALRALVALTLVGASSPLRAPALPGEAEEAEAAAPPPPEGEALLAATAALVRDHGVWLSSKVRPAWLGAGRGVGVVATAPVKRGELLMRGALTPESAMRSDLRHEWESDAFAALVDDFGAAVGPSMRDSVRLSLKLAHVFLRSRADDASVASPLEQYVRACSPSKTSRLTLWPQKARELLRGSAILATEERLMRGTQQLAQHLLARWPASAGRPSQQELVEALDMAVALMGSRCFDDITYGRRLTAVLDLCNHASKTRCNARAQHDAVNSLEWFLRAEADIPEGEEVLVCYDPDKAFLDMWRIYGFFDSTADNHAVWITVQAGVIAPSHSGGFYTIKEGVSPLDCELFSELYKASQSRVGLGRDEEIGDGKLRVSAAYGALLRFEALVRQHLAGYPPDSEEPPSEEEGGDVDPLRPYRGVAREIVRYERVLLMNTLDRVEQELSALDSPGDSRAAPRPLPP